MTEKLTEDTLCEIANGWGATPTAFRVQEMATELLALRAERAKPTPSDEERDGHEWAPPAGDSALTAAELQEELAQAKDESDERGLDIDVLSQMLGEARDQRDRARNEVQRMMEGVKKIEKLLEIPEDERGFDFGTINRAIASIRAEGSAERAKLEAALRKYEHDFCEGWCKENGGTFDDCSGCIAKAALAQPAGSGATGLRDKTDDWDFKHAKRRVIEQTEHGFVARDRRAKS